ncbi:DUF6378 domain-containing protein [Acinetobacter proteolyticus]|nr:DUF6378 domain-containing protein [Acinetobacter proteolyticus]WEI20097.1 DUF6378 domain-containing protein [Acinetobacter proteolyticus]
MNIKSTLEQRGERYGKFKDVATTTYGLQAILRDAKSHEHMSEDQIIALDMICNKVARIVNGDPNYIDNWHDIAGYATLVEQELNMTKRDGEGR